MICSKCGTQNNDNSKFCIGCGNSLIQEQNTNVESFINKLYNEPTIETNTQQTNQTNSQPINNVQQPQQQNTKKTINKKLLFIIGGIVLGVSIVIIFLFIFLGGNEKSKYLSELFDLEQPIPVYKDGNYVYIDTTGKIIKNIKYNEASDFKGNYAFVELENGTAALIDKNQNVKVSATSYYGMEYITEYDIWLIDGVLYNNKLNPITNKTINLTYDESGFFTYSNAELTEYGVINKDGKKIYSNKCLINSLDINTSNDESYAIVETSCYEGNKQIEKEFIISLQTGKVLYENEYKSTHQDSYYYYLLNYDSDNMYYIVDENYDKIKYLYLKNNEILYSADEKLYDIDLYGEDYLELDFGYDYDEIGKEQQYYYYNLKTKKLEEEKPELSVKDIEIKIPKDVKQRQIVKCDNGKGLIDDKKVIIPCIYNDIEYISTNVHDYILQTKSMDLMIVENEDKQISIYDANSKKDIIKFENSKKSDIKDYDNSLFIIQKIYVDDSLFSDLEKTIVYNLLTGNKLAFDSKSDLEIKLNYFTETKNGKKVYYNMNFEKIYTES